MIRLIRNYQTASREDLARLMGSYTNERHTLDHMFARSWHNDEIEDSHDRIQARHKAVGDMLTASRGNRIVVIVLSQIETIKFARDWTRQTGKKGGKKWASQFYKRAFQEDSAYAPQFANLSHHARDQLFETLAPEFKRWKTVVRRAVTARSRLENLFTLVWL
ncbi:hypothetical protein OBBRIDRAFT_48857 [Obba rivulosa]|uniref:Uncharacterized protein n=1 Tax=Obba rivulosa TaxID=1052685 RepID=A0A8E2DSI2_9APHY|nr:hypothetical protein OBBRIDRAFT_48857 [Obba rivulosa]